MGERWRAVPGAEMYEASSFGRVRRVTRATNTYEGRILRPVENGRGYPVVNLWVRGKRYQRQVHQLVAEAFLGPKPTVLHEVAHNDGNSRNPQAANLRWATRAENHADKLRHGTHNRGQRHGLSKLTDEQAAEIIRLRKAGVQLRDLAAIFAVSLGCVRKLLSGESWAWLPR